MTFNIDLIQKYYHDLPAEIDKLRRLTKRPLTFTEKILFTHLSGNLKDFQRGRDYVEFNPDRVAMQDATGQMALLQFMMADRDNVAVPTTVHCDHLICCEIRGPIHWDMVRPPRLCLYMYMYMYIYM